MNILRKEVGFRYISYEIKDNNNEYTAIKAFDGLSGNISRQENIVVRDFNGNIVKDKNLLEKINTLIEEHE